MKAIVVLIVCFLVVGCSNSQTPQKYTKLTCESGIDTPWTELFTFQLYPEGRLTYKSKGRKIHDHIQADDRCVQTYKKAIPGTEND